MSAELVSNDFLPLVLCLWSLFTGAIGRGMRCSPVPLAVASPSPNLPISLKADREVGGEMGSHLMSLGLTWHHLVSRGLTWSQLASLGLSWLHSVSHGLTWSHLASLGLTRLH